MTKQWSAIPGYVGHYEVSDEGRVRSLKPRTRARGGILRPDRDRGYLRACLVIDGVIARPRIHQLVALAFIGPQPDGEEVRHIDGVRDHNIPSNLIYGTSAENRADTLIHGTHNMARKTHCKRGHEFTPENTALVTLASGSAARRCRKCDVIRSTAYRQGKKVAS